MFAICGCKNKSDRRDNESLNPSFRVALLMPGPASDAGWNASAFDGIQQIKAKMGAETAVVQTISAADFEDAFRDFASRGFNVIFAHGFEYTDAAIKVAHHFPNTWFIVSSGSQSTENVASLSFKVEEAAYVEGVVSGITSKTGIVGGIGGIELPSIRLAFDGYRQGFKSVRADGRVLVSYTGSFEDVASAKEAALALISRRADLLIHEADAAGLGVFQAANDRHVFAFGMSRNQNDVAPDAILASAVVDIPAAFLRIASEIRAAKFHSGMLEYGMKDGMVKVVFNPVLVSKIPASAIERARLAEADIIAGRIVVGQPSATN